MCIYIYIYIYIVIYIYIYIHCDMYRGVYTSPRDPEGVADAGRAALARDEPMLFHDYCYHYY